LGIKRNIFESVGGFNEELVLCGNDVELCFRIQDAGYRNVYNPFIKLLHEESATRGGPIPARDYRVSYDCYKPYLQNGDPYYNVNLSLWSLIPRIKGDSEIHPNVFALDFLQKLNV
jgi:GT2 family glycosyltransferase